MKIALAGRKDRLWLRKTALKRSKLQLVLKKKRGFGFEQYQIKMPDGYTKHEAKRFVWCTRLAF
ncbi:MAG: hypothetical protein RL481_1392, partial [Pseudomonadota bacterium]